MSLRWLKPVDILSICFLSLLLLLTLVFYDKIPAAGALIIRYVGVSCAVALAAYSHGRRPGSSALKYVHDFLPLFVVLFTFDSLSHLTHYVNPVDKDAALAALDRSIFGGDPAVLLQGFINPYLTTILQICYTSYYFLPIVFCVMLYRSGERGSFDLSVFGILLGFFVSYVGYLLVPALGPRFHLDGELTRGLMRGPLAAGIDSTLNMLEGENRDAFPSGHTEVVIIVLIYAWTYRRWYFWMALPLVTGLIISTVYLRYHYVVDVLAGMILAPLCVFLATWLYKSLKPTFQGETS